MIDISRPAFPSSNPVNFVHGMSIRDYFAAHVAAGIASASIDHVSNECIANTAYKIADEMLVEGGHKKRTQGT